MNFFIWMRISPIFFLADTLHPPLFLLCGWNTQRWNSVICTHQLKHTHTQKSEHGKADTIVLTGGMENDRSTWNRSRVLYAFIIDISLQLHLASSTHTSLDLLSRLFAHTSTQQMYCNKLNRTKPWVSVFHTVFALYYFLSISLYVRIFFHSFEFFHRLLNALSYRTGILRI